MIEQTIKKNVETPAQRWENEGGAPIHDEKKGTGLEDRIRERAFAIYSSLAGRGEPGDAAADWARAEREVAAQPGSAESPLPVTVATGRRDGVSRASR